MLNTFGYDHVRNSTNPGKEVGHPISQSRTNCGSPCHATVRVVTLGFREAVWDHFPCEYITTFGTTKKLWSSAIPALNRTVYIELVSGCYCFFFDQQTSCLGPKQKTYHPADFFTFLDAAKTSFRLFWIRGG